MRGIYLDWILGHDRLPPSGGRSALLLRLRHEATQLRHNLRALARGALDLRLPVLRDRHGQLEGLLALLAKELVSGHSGLLVCPTQSSPSSAHSGPSIQPRR